MRMARMSHSSVPPFSREGALERVRFFEDTWNTRDPNRVLAGCAADSNWQGQNQVILGRSEIEIFILRKWAGELDYRLISELWAYVGNRISVRVAYEYRSVNGDWFRAHGDENWEFGSEGLMRRRIASINELPIAGADRKLLWPLGCRPTDSPSLSALGL
jgi:nuclear transport factor 2 (NTF2) superfamily protein